jgi:hypothetical protein
MAADANKTVEKINWPEIKLHRPVTNKSAIKMSLFKLFILKFLKILTERGVLIINFSSLSIV